MAEKSPWRLRFEDPDYSFDGVMVFERKGVESINMSIRFYSDRTIRRIIFYISNEKSSVSVWSIKANLPPVQFEDILDLDIVRGPVETKAKGLEAYLEHGYDPDNRSFCRVCGNAVKTRRHFFSFSHFFRHHYSGVTIKSASKA